MSDPQPEPPPYAGRPGRVLAFRVNRRPLAQPTLLAPEGPPEDVLDHFLRVLAPGYEVITGRRHQRVWRVGGVRSDRESQTVVGRLGWEPRGEARVTRWSKADKDWTTRTTDPLGGEIMPFGFDGETRLLAILRAPDSDPSTLATVFQSILDENERELPERSVEWSVEPILDRQTFLSWLRRVDVVRSVTFTARLPNPEPRDAFADLARRMEERKATQHTESMRSDREEGLIHPEEDRDISQAIAMAEQGYAELRGVGVRGENESTFSQRETVATERVPQVPEDWPGAWAMLTAFLKGRLRRYLDDEAA